MFGIKVSERKQSIYTESSNLPPNEEGEENTLF
jgi:hypothetical protein